MSTKKPTVTEKAALRKKAAAALRATLKKSALALEESRCAHELAEKVAAQLEEDAAAEHQLAEAEAQGYLSFGPEDALPATPPEVKLCGSPWGEIPMPSDKIIVKDTPKKKSFWQRIVGWVNND